MKTRKKVKRGKIKKRRAKKILYVEKFRNEKYIVIRDNGRVKRKKYNPKTYDDDIANYKEFRSFYNPKQTKSYGKSYTFKSGTTVRYRTYDDKNERGKGVRNESRYTFYQIYVEGYVVRNGHKYYYARSSDKHELGYPKDAAKQEAINRFYQSGQQIYLYDEKDKKKYDSASSKQQTLIRHLFSRGDEPVIENIYITYL
jgi:hypothetical protein